VGGKGRIPHGMSGDNSVGDVRAGKAGGHGDWDGLVFDFLFVATGAIRIHGDRKGVGPGGAVRFRYLPERRGKGSESTAEGSGCALQN